MKNAFKNKRIVVICLALCLLLGTLCGVGCSTHTDTTMRTYLMMDTVIEITLYCDAAQAHPVLERCGEIMAEVEGHLSRTLPESNVSALNSEGQAALDGDTLEALRTARAVCERTNGAFDPTVGALVELWDRCGEEGRMPATWELEAACATVGSSHLQLTENGTATLSSGTQLDLGAVGKGYAIDLVRAYLESTDIPGGVISFGGNVAVFGQKTNGKPYRIGVRDPKNTAGVLGYLSMSEGVISVSGDYERYVTINGVHYHHILDPATGYPAENGLHSVAVICSDGAAADALSTALFVMGLEKGMDFYHESDMDFEAIFVTDHEVILTDGLRTSGDFALGASTYRLQ